MKTLYALSPSQVSPAHVHLDREELAAIAAEYDRDEDLEIFAELSPESEEDELEHSKGTP